MTQQKWASLSQGIAVLKAPIHPTTRTIKISRLTRHKPNYKDINHTNAKISSFDHTSQDMNPTIALYRCIDAYISWRVQALVEGCEII